LELLQKKKIMQKAYLCCWYTGSIFCITNLNVDVRLLIRYADQEWLIIESTTCSL
jgi:hypothetical protein